MATVLVLILVFAAVVALGYISLSTFQTEAYERASLVREEEGNVSPLRKMVSPVQMAKYRLNTGFGAAVFFFVLFSALDFRSPFSPAPSALSAPRSCHPCGSGARWPRAWSSSIPR